MGQAVVVNDNAGGGLLRGGEGVRGYLLVLE